MQFLAIITIVSSFVAGEAQDTCFEQCPALVIGQLDERFFSALRKVESGGDLCVINGNKIGPYQISEQYFDVAKQCRPSLLNEGQWLAVIKSFVSLYYQACLPACSQASSS